MRKIIVIISAVLVVAALVSAAVLISGAEEITVVASGDCGDQGDNVKWTLDSAGTLTVTGTGDMKGYSQKR